MEPDEVEEPVGSGGLCALHRSTAGRLEDLRDAGAGGAWLERRAEAGWGLHWSEEDRGHGERKLGAEPVPRLGRGVGWARKWGGVLVKLKGKGTD